MKALILGNIYPAGKKSGPTYSWFVLTFYDGLIKNGIEVKGLNYRTTSLKKIKEVCLDWKPDLIFTHMSFRPDINPIPKVLQLYKDIKNKISTKIIHTYNDYWNEDRYMGDLREIFDLALVGQTENLKKLADVWKIPTVYCPYSSLTYEKIVSPSKDLMFEEPVFTGSPRMHPDRRKFIELLQQRIPLKIIETQSPGDLRSRTPELSISAKCILGLCTGYEVEGYIDVRPFQYLGTGAFMIMRQFKGMDHIVPSNLYVPFYGYSVQDAEYVKELWYEWKNKDTSAIRTKAFDFIQKYHSSQVRLRGVLEFIEGIRDKIPVFIEDLE